jgi:outer membrane protein TolC
MKRALVVAWVCGCLHGAEPRPDTPAVLRFEEVLDRAVSRATVEDARVEMSRDQLRLLETLGKTRFELRPTLGLLAFSNPVLLATNIGTGLLLNRRTAPTRAALEGARFDTLASELQSHATRIRARVEAARLYFELLEKQEIGDRAEAALNARKRQSAEIDRLLNASRITASDRIAFEQELLDLEAQSVEVHAQRKAAAARLAVLIGALELSQRLRLEESGPKFAAWDRPAPPLDELLKSAAERRGDLRLLREKIDGLRRESPSSRKPQIESVSAGYARVTNAPGTTNVPGFLLGGHTGRGEFTFNIPLKDTGEKAAENTLRLARIRFLETEVRNVEDSIRAEIMTFETEAAVSLERVRLSSRKLELTRKAYQAVESRVAAGLAPLSALAQVERAVLDAHWNHARSINQRKSSLFTLYTLAGLDQEATVSQLSVRVETGTNPTRQ